MSNSDDVDRQQTTGTEESTNRVMGEGGEKFNARVTQWEQLSFLPLQERH